jgi:1-acyl-sn-glycerol-3-phosphate acyltransferase
VRVLYQTVKAAFRFAKLPCIREHVLGLEHVSRRGGLVLACSHLSFLEPLFVGTLLPRPIRWMTRVEFYRPRWAAAALDSIGAFPVDRFGRPGPAVRSGVRLAGAGQIVGIFPEGGVARGSESALRGGPLKQGACAIAIQAQVPIVPVVVLGTERLNRIRPWLPTRSGQVWIAFGEPVVPPARAWPRRPLRSEMALELSDRFTHTYQRLLREAGLRDEDFP